MGPDAVPDLVGDKMPYRTPLFTSTNSAVSILGDSDEYSGPPWEAAIVEHGASWSHYGAPVYNARGSPIALTMTQGRPTRIAPPQNSKSGWRFSPLTS